VREIQQVGVLAQRGFGLPLERLTGRDSVSSFLRFVTSDSDRRRGM
jgi:hypothetical protein